MKINGSADSVRLDGSLTRPTGQAAAKTPAVATTSTLTANPSAVSAPTLSSVNANSAAHEPAFDAARVDTIKAAIRDGRFQVDSGMVADKLLSSVHELLCKPH